MRSLRALISTLVIIALWCFMEVYIFALPAGPYRAMMMLVTYLLFIIAGLSLGTAIGERER